MNYTNDTRIKANRRKVILHTAMQMFYERGISNTTVMDIANEVKMGRSTMYEYFNCKNELLIYTRNHYLGKMYEFELDVDYNLSGEEQLKSILKKYFDFMLDNPEAMLFFLEYIRYIESNENSSKGLGMPHYKTHKDLVHAILQGKIDDTLKSENIEKRIAIVMEALLGVSTRFAVKDKYVYENRNMTICKEDMKELIDIVMNGI